MKRRNKFITAFAAAAFTFGTLWITMGSESFNRGHRHHHGHWEHHHPCNTHDSAEMETLE